MPKAKKELTLKKKQSLACDAWVKEHPDHTEWGAGRTTVTAAIQHVVKTYSIPLCDASINQMIGARRRASSGGKKTIAQIKKKSKEATAQRKEDPNKMTDEQRRIIDRRDIISREAREKKEETYLAALAMLPRNQSLANSTAFHTPSGTDAKHCLSSHDSVIHASTTHPEKLEGVLYDGAILEPESYLCPHPPKTGDGASAVWLTAGGAAKSLRSRQLGDIGAGAAAASAASASEGAASAASASGGAASDAEAAEGASPLMFAAQAGLYHLYTHHKVSIFQESTPNVYLYEMLWGHPDYWRLHPGSPFPGQEFYIKCCHPIRVAEGTPGVAVWRVVCGPVPQIYRMY